MSNADNSSYRVILEGGEGVYEEKKSRFIATVRKAESESEAVAFIEEMKKKYWDARHNCSALIIGSKGELTRCSDDGEPSGTAGRPMLEVLIGSGIKNVCVVVTRYFGGVLLGTGGLVRAYTQAVQEGIAACKVGRMRLGQELDVKTDYNGIGKILYYLSNESIEPASAEYTEAVSLKLIIPVENVERIRKNLVEITSGRVEIAGGDKYYFVDNE